MLWVGTLVYSFLCLPFLSTAVIFSCGWVLIGIVALENNTRKLKQAQLRKKVENEAEAKAKMEIIAEEKKRQIAIKTELEAAAAAAVAKAQLEAEIRLTALSTPTNTEKNTCNGSSAKSLDATQIRVRTGIQYKVVSGQAPSTGIQKNAAPELPLAESTLVEDSASTSNKFSEAAHLEPIIVATGPLSKKGSGSYHLKQAH
jgi:hypothetical protein